ncbi:DUF397 domain-containing protein [Saccharothrix australiensis]|uniref:Uncharacterized protein DUF397 n=1 Tax=Saccharothrix australiensis TaxID=2072 RepID=A0A495VNK6_9PSEU|nr:DUF397 domain-containing protein [Saccharothrix australiensis]RKT49280.1 uncharacterized protein DUF397 [Saccharothrix australiensis]RKT49378.1 uncharacterized protein DUF397 [Saccharothrix australiensis]
MAQPAPSGWRRSSRSGSESNCVEIKSGFGLLRDSKHPEVELPIHPAALRAFLRSVGQAGS